MVKALIPPSTEIDQRVVCLPEGGPPADRVCGDHPKRKCAQPLRAKTPTEVLGEDTEGLLGLLVSGEAKRKHPNRLCAPVDIGDHVNPDLVVKELLHPVTSDRGVDADEQVPVLHHHTCHCLADMYQGRQLWETPTIMIELDVGPSRQFVGIDVDVGSRARRDLLEHTMCQLQQRLLDMPVLLDCCQEELVRVPGPQQLEPALQLPVHATDHVNQNRIRCLLRVDGGQLIGKTVQVGKIAVAERRFIRDAL